MTKGGVQINLVFHKNIKLAPKLFSTLIIIRNDNGMKSE